MKRMMIALLCTSFAGLTHAQDHDIQSFSVNCSGGGQKSITYDWTVFTSAITYTATLSDCSLAGDDRKFNGTITGNGTLAPSTAGFNVFMTVQEELSVTGSDTGNISCTTGLQGTYTTATANFNGTVTKNNCSFSVNASGVDLVELLSQLSYK